MKKTLSILLVTSMILACVGCSGDKNAETSVSVTETTTVTTETEATESTAVPVTGVYELFEGEKMFEVVEEATVYSDVSLTEVINDAAPVGGSFVCIATHGDYIVTDSGYYIINTALKEVS